MARSPSADAAEVLLDLARTSIRGGLSGLPPLVPDLSEAPDVVQAPGAAFVTVTVDDDLNGCIGTLERDEPLGVAVARLAWDAAFADPRLPRLRVDEVPTARVKVAVLGPLEPLAADSEAVLCDQLRPGVDGLLLVADGRRATFLPAVWATLPAPVDFVHHLEAKAGLRPGRWPQDAAAWRYVAEEFEADLAG